MRKSIHSSPYVVLRESLTQARITAAVTQEGLAKDLGRPQSYVAKYETGDRRLDVVEFLEVCAVLDLDSEEILHTVRKALFEQ